MSAAVHVLVAFASQNGSTAGIAGTIASELREAGLEADCRPVAAVTDLAPYDAVVLGSGVFVVRSASDGGGFIAGHREELARRALWLFSAGPIGSAESPGASESPRTAESPGTAQRPGDADAESPGTAERPGDADAAGTGDRSTAATRSDDETPVMRVAQAVGARGAARFGHAPLRAGAREAGLPPDDWRDTGRVRVWARSIASALGRPASSNRRSGVRWFEPALRS